MEICCMTQGTQTGKYLEVDFLVVWLSAGVPGGTVLKNPPVSAGNTRDTSWILRSRKSPGKGKGNPLQYSYLKDEQEFAG